MEIHLKDGPQSEKGLAMEQQQESPVLGKLTVCGDDDNHDQNADLMEIDTDSDRNCAAGIIDQEIKSKQEISITEGCLIDGCDESSYLPQDVGMAGVQASHDDSTYNQGAALSAAVPKEQPQMSNDVKCCLPETDQSISSDVTGTLMTPSCQMDPKKGEPKAANQHGKDVTFSSPNDKCDEISSQTMNVDESKSGLSGVHQAMSSQSMDLAVGFTGNNSAMGLLSLAMHRQDDIDLTLQDVVNSQLSYLALTESETIELSHVSICKENEYCEVDITRGADGSAYEGIVNLLASDYFLGEEKKEALLHAKCQPSVVAVYNGCSSSFRFVYGIFASIQKAPDDYDIAYVVYKNELAYAGDPTQAKKKVTHEAIQKLLFNHALRCFQEKL